MANEGEGGAPHTEVAPVVVPKTNEETVALPKEEHAELTRKAEVSSQNFERLQKEKEKTAELEAEIARLKGESVPSSFDDDKVKELESDVAAIKARQAKADVLEAHPQLKDLWSDFESFRDNPDNKGMNLKTAAKAFLAEKGLIDAPRPGLERPTGGDRTPLSSGMSSEDAKKLRETDYKKYSEMVRKGQIKVT